NQDGLKALMEEAGFEQCAVRNLSGGIVAIHSGFKI
ncbi:MAG: class I SAM-dependent methyltransferase, partial [Candidatus Methylopumilus sp.]|nr:class I SAM-dependent methyltransferase [Candidatus Methylopumilus sp.]